MYGCVGIEYPLTRTRLEHSLDTLGSIPTLPRIPSSFEPSGFGNVK